MDAHGTKGRANRRRGLPSALATAARPIVFLEELAETETVEAL